MYLVIVMPTPISGFVIRKLRLDIAYIYAKFDNSSFSSSRDVIGAAKFTMSHLTL